MKYVDIVFDGPPGPEGGRFVEVEDETGASIRFGNWVEREDGFWALMTPHIQDFKTVFVAWANSDLTEGRGYSIPYVVCDSKTTAERLGSKKSVQGCDCTVTKETALKVGGKWLAPARIEPSSKEDDAGDERIEKRENAVKKALAAGLTNAEIDAITNYK